MGNRKLRSEFFRADHLLAGEDHGSRLLTAADGETFTPGNALTVDADGNVTDSGASGSGIASTFDTWANLPGSPATGDLFKSSDSPYMCRYNGSSWDCWAFDETVTVPDNSGYSDLSGGAPSSVSTTTGLLIVTHSGSASFSIRGRHKAIGSSIEIGFTKIGGGGNFHHAGLFLVETGTGKIVTYFSSQTGVEALKCNSRTSANSAYTLSTGIAQENQSYHGTVMLKIEWGATNRVFSIKRPGMGSQWYPLHTIAKNDFATTAFDEWGFYVNSENSDPVIMSIWHLDDS